MKYPLTGRFDRSCFSCNFGKISYPCSGPLPLKWKGPGFRFPHMETIDMPIAKLKFGEIDKFETILSTPQDRPPGNEDGVGGAGSADRYQ